MADLRNHSQVLLARWQELEESDDATHLKQQWFVDCYEFLQSTHGHWWCEHEDVTSHLAEVLRFYPRAVVGAMWGSMCSQMAGCIQCVTAYHHTKRRYREQFEGEAVAELLTAMDRLDVARLVGWLGARGADGELPPQLVTGVYETLVHDELMATSNEVAAALVGALGHMVSVVDVELPAEGGRYPGLYRLLGHPSASARALALPLVRSLGSFSSWEEGAESVWGALHDWTATLQAWLQSGGLGAHAAHMQQQQQQQGVTPAPGGSAQDSAREESAWLGLKVVLQLLEPDALEGALLGQLGGSGGGADGGVVRHSNGKGHTGVTEGSEDGPTEDEGVGDGRPGVPGLLEVILSAACSAPAPNTPARTLNLYRSILTCLVLVLRGLGARLWVHGVLAPDGLGPNGAGGRALGHGQFGDEDSGEGRGEWHGVWLGRGGLGDALMGAFGCVHDEATQKAVLSGVHALLDTLAAAPVRLVQAREVYPLLAFLRFQVALCNWRRNPPLTPLVRSSAALAALAGIRSALLLGTAPSCLGAHVWGAAACAEVGRITAVAGAQGAHVRAEAAKLLCVVLQMDASVLAAQLDAGRLASRGGNAVYHSHHHPAGISDAFAELALPAPEAASLQGAKGGHEGAGKEEGSGGAEGAPSPHSRTSSLRLAVDQLVGAAEGRGLWLGGTDRAFASSSGADGLGLDGQTSGSGGGGRRLGLPAVVCPAAWPEVDATSACEVHLDNLELYRCCPAYWVWAGGGSGRSASSNAPRAPHPAVAAALLAAAAHVAGALPPPGQDPGTPAPPHPPTHGGATLGSAGPAGFHVDALAGLQGHVNGGGSGALAGIAGVAPPQLLPAPVVRALAWRQPTGAADTGGGAGGWGGLSQGGPGAGVWGEEGAGEEGEDDSVAAERAQSVLLATYPRSLLGELRAAAGALLSSAAAAGHILGPQAYAAQQSQSALGSSPGVIPATQLPMPTPAATGASTGASKPLGTPAQDQVEGRGAQQALGPELGHMELVGVRAALRLMMGVHEGLRHMALTALCAHLHLPVPPAYGAAPAAHAPRTTNAVAVAAASTPDTGAAAAARRAVQQCTRGVLGALLAQGGDHASCVLAVAWEALQEVSCRSSSVQLLTQQGLEPVLLALAMLLQAADWCVEGSEGVRELGEEGEALAQQLRVLCARSAALAHAVLGGAQPHALRVAAASPGHATSLAASLQHLFSIASGCWFYLLSPVLAPGPGAAPPPRSSNHAAPVSARTLSHALAACVVQLLRWGAISLTTAAQCLGASPASITGGSGVAEDSVSSAWGDAVDALLVQLREFGGVQGSLPERVLDAARTALAPGTALTDTARDRLMTLVPEAALRATAQKSALAGLPSRAPAQAPAPQQQAAPAAGQADGTGLKAGQGPSPGRLRQTQLQDAFGGAVRMTTSARSQARKTGSAVCIDLTADSGEEEEEEAEAKNEPAPSAAAPRLGPAAAAAAAAAMRLAAQTQAVRPHVQVGAASADMQVDARVAAKPAHKPPSVMVRRKLAAAAATAVLQAAHDAQEAGRRENMPTHDNHTRVGVQAKEQPHGPSRHTSGDGGGSAVDAWLAREARQEEEEDRDNMTLAQLKLRQRTLGRRDADDPEEVTLMQMILRAKAAKARQQQEARDKAPHAAPVAHHALARGAPGQYPTLRAPQQQPAAAAGYKPFAHAVKHTGAEGGGAFTIRQAGAGTSAGHPAQQGQPGAQPPLQQQPPPPRPPPKPAVRLVVDDDDFLAGELATLDAARQLQQQQQAARNRGLLAALAGSAAGGGTGRQAVMLAAGGGRGPLGLRGPGGILGATRVAPAKPALRMDDVHTTILGWDLVLDVLQPPGGSSLVAGAGGSGRGQQHKVRRMERFPDMGTYVAHFRRLLLEELRASVAASVEELASSAGAPGARVRLQSVQRQDKLQMVVASVEAPADGAPPPPPGQGGYGWENGSFLREGDLLLLTRTPLKNPAVLSSAAELPTRRMLAIVVESAMVQGVRELKVKVAAFATDNAHDRPQLGAPGPLLIGTTSATTVGRPHGPAAVAVLASELTPRSVWIATQLHSLIPHMREFQALCNFHLLTDNLRAFLLSPPRHAPSQAAVTAAGGPSQMLASVTADPMSVMEALKTGGVPKPMQELLAQQYNVSQLAAIASVLRPSSRFSLIQGPPGTGKTSAILAVVSVLLAGCTATRTAGTPGGGDKPDEVARHTDGVAKAVPQYKKPAAAKRRAGVAKAAAAAGSTGPGGEGLGEGPLQLGSTPPVRILVCAQSNAAIDELVARLAREMVLRQDGTRSLPGLVRLGRSESMHPDAIAYHVDALAERLAGNSSAVVEAGSRQEVARRRVGELREAFVAAQEALQAKEAEVDARASHRRAANAKAITAHGGGGPEGAEDEMWQMWGEEGGGEGGDQGMGEASEGGLGFEFVDSLALRELRERLHKTRATLQEAEREVRGGVRELERARRDVRAAVVRAAEITVCTLSVAGGELASFSASSAAGGGGGGGGAGRGGPGGATGAGGLGGAGGGSAHGLPPFDALIVDEAAQALEPATLIPLRALAPGARIILVGDPNQLPPTVISRAAGSGLLDTSLFERLQYRMHPAISTFPSSYFYSSQLRDGVSAAQRTAQWHPPPSGPRPLPIGSSQRSATLHPPPAPRKASGRQEQEGHEEKGHKFVGLGPLVFWDVEDGREGRGAKGRGAGGGGGGAGASLQNRAEADVAAWLYKGLLEACPSFSGSVAVITPYRAQLSLLRQTFRPYLPLGTREDERPGGSGRGGSGASAQPPVGGGGSTGAAGQPRVDFGTVDGFQGREADVVIFSCVRAAPSGRGSTGGTPSIGFLNDVRRMNVALTRARCSLWVVGHANTLRHSPPWQALLQHTAEQGLLCRTQATTYPQMRLCLMAPKRLESKGDKETAAVAPAPFSTQQQQTQAGARTHPGAAGATAALPGAEQSHKVAAVGAIPHTQRQVPGAPKKKAVYDDDFDGLTEPANNASQAPAVTVGAAKAGPDPQGQPSKSATTATTAARAAAAAPAAVHERGPKDDREPSRTPAPANDSGKLGPRATGMTAPKHLHPAQDERTKRPTPHRGGQGSGGEAQPPLKRPRHDNQQQQQVATGERQVPGGMAPPPERAQHHERPAADGSRQGEGTTGSSGRKRPHVDGAGGLADTGAGATTTTPGSTGSAAAEREPSCTAPSGAPDVASAATARPPPPPSSVGVVAPATRVGAGGPAVKVARLVPKTLAPEPAAAAAAAPTMPHHRQAPHKHAPLPPKEAGGGQQVSLGGRAQAQQHTHTAHHQDQHRQQHHEQPQRPSAPAAAPVRTRAADGAHVVAPATLPAQGHGHGGRVAAGWLRPSRPPVDRAAAAAGGTSRQAATGQASERHVSDRQLSERQAPHAGGSRAGEQGRGSVGVHRDVSSQGPPRGRADEQRHVKAYKDYVPPPAPRKPS